MCVLWCSGEGTKNYVPLARASSRDGPEQKSWVLYTNTKGTREREGARAHATFPERGGEDKTCVRMIRIILKNIFRICSMGAQGKRVNERSVEICEWIAIYGIILFIFRLFTITRKISIY